MKKTIYTYLLTCFAISLFGQPVKYLDQGYTSIEASYDYVYAENATVLYFPDLGEAIKEPLFFDLYKPVKEDPDCNGGLRPLIIFFHSGNFIPFPYNQSPVGTKRDSSVVEICRRLASTGYVVASADYRLGWNPYDEELFARAGLINAAYRGVQDANTCIRYFKKTVAEEGNPFGIDTNQIVLFGDDTGGYLSIHASALDDYNKIPTASKQKFLFPTGLPEPYNFLPMILEGLNGDVEGKNYGIMTADLLAYGIPFPVGDTLCYSNYPEYSSSFKVAVSLGAAVADTAWIDPGQPPIISIHFPYDETTPCGEDYLYVGDQQILEVQGSCVLIPVVNALGNNTCLTPPEYSSDFQEEVTTVAHSRSGGVENLLLVIGDTISDGTPWNFWNATEPNKNANSEIGLMDNPRMSREKGELYIDTILAFVLPRLYTCMDLCITSTEKLVNSEEVNIIVYPNPVFEEVFVGAGDGLLIRSLSIYDLKGTLVKQYTGINSNYYHLPVNELVSGQYIVKFLFDDGVAARQIVVK